MDRRFAVGEFDFLYLGVGDGLEPARLGLGFCMAVRQVAT